MEKHGQESNEVTLGVQRRFHRRGDLWARFWRMNRSSPGVQDREMYVRQRNNTCLGIEVSENTDIKQRGEGGWERRLQKGQEPDCEGHGQSFIQQIYTEHLLCVGLCSRPWGYSSEQKRQKSLPSWFWRIQELGLYSVSSYHFKEGKYTVRFEF